MRSIFLAVIIVIVLVLSADAMAGDPLEGRAIYVENCAGCHGANGRAVVAGTPNFAGSNRLMVKTDSQLHDTIAGGKNIMPAFQGRLSEREMMDVIAYIRTFF